MKPTSIIQYFLPHHALSWLAGKILTSRWTRLKNAQIRKFIRDYHVNMQEAAQTDLSAYPTFHDFFIRHLKPGVRSFPTDSKAIASPVDGKISQIGLLKGSELVQAKGRFFSLTALLTPDAGAASLFQDGSFTTIYLAPKDYHRIHMPVTGTLRRMIFIPGRLFSVNPQTVADIDNIFARNERLVCLFDTELGPCAVILVGAIVVGSMSVVWHGLVKPQQRHKPTVWDYPNSGDGMIQLQRGEELGYFTAGSTVILLFGKDKMTWGADCIAGDEVRLGQVLGIVK